MTVDRLTPTSTTHPSDIDGDTYADEVSEEVGGLWKNSALWLDSIAGTGNAITAAVSPTLDSYKKGQHYWLIPAAANTSAVTLNIDSQGARSIKNADGSELDSATLSTTVMVLIVDNGTNFVLFRSSSASGGGARSVPTLLDTFTLAVSSQNAPSDTLSLEEYQHLLIEVADMTTVGATQARVQFSDDDGSNWGTGAAVLIGGSDGVDGGSNQNIDWSLSSGAMMGQFDATHTGWGICRVEYAGLSTKTIPKGIITEMWMDSNDWMKGHGHALQIGKINKIRIHNLSSNMDGGTCNVYAY